MNTTATILKAAHDLIAKPENWTQLSFARNDDGKPTDPTSPEAVCFCASGAISRISLGVEGGEEAAYVFAGFTKKGIPDFNDTHTHSEVLDLFSKAIKAAEGEQP